ncbi:MAG: ABC1 kinase family protein [Acidobacteriota bacterium]
MPAATRRQRLHTAVADALSRWDAAGGGRAVAEAAPAGGDVRRALPRRERLPAGVRSFTPPLAARPELRASPLATVARVFVWLYAALLYGVGNCADALRRRGSPQRRAERLRHTLERIGGTFLKVGQQLSMRIDMLPMPVCAELGKLLDNVPPFPVEVAIATIERATGRPLAATFSVFDPEPIGSASLACVYQAVLVSGEKVAVKVRRPRAAERFAADWRAISWLVGVIEALALVRPGQLGPMVRDLASMFLEELDFRREARSTDLFRRRARRSRLRFLTAPRVYFELSNDEVLVTELVSGVWLWEVLGAVESGNSESLAYLRSRDIDPVLVAHRLFEASLFGIFENLIFHADPHPGNVVIRPGSEIVLIDFGSCGSYQERQLAILRHFHYCHANEDASGMVQCALALLEPLPPVDVDALTLEMEEAFSESMRAIKSRGSQWWERTSAPLWIGFLRLARRYHVRVGLDILRTVRSTLLYDTLAARLYGKIDIYAEYQRFRRHLAKAARKRFRGRVRRFLERGLDDHAFLRLEELGDLGERLTYRLQRFADAPSFKFSLLAGKAVFAATAAVRWLASTAAVGGLAVLAVGLGRVAAGRSLDAAEVVAAVGHSPWFLGFAALLLFATVRLVLFRFQDREV